MKKNQINVNMKKNRCKISYLNIIFHKKIKLRRLLDDKIIIGKMSQNFLHVNRFKKKI